MPGKENLKKVLLLSLIGIVPATVSGILTTCQAQMEARMGARDAEKYADESSEAVLGGTGAAIKELQRAVVESHEWSEGMTDQVKMLLEKVITLQQDVAYLKGYVEHVNKGRYRKERPAPTATEPKLPAPPSKKPSVALPEDLADAKQQLRDGVF